MSKFFQKLAMLATLAVALFGGPTACTTTLGSQQPSFETLVWADQQQQRRQQRMDQATQAESEAEEIMNPSRVPPIIDECDFDTHGRGYKHVGSEGKSSSADRWFEVNCLKKRWVRPQAAVYQPTPVDVVTSHSAVVPPASSANKDDVVWRKEGQ